MENFNVSGVSGTPNAGASYEVKKQEDAKKMGAIPMTSGGGQSEQVDKPQDFNVYGKDIANFDKFKGNDKHDAMRMTNTVANDVKRQYMQLKHEFPDVELTFEPMPDPTTCGKKREGFLNYQQQLDDWKDMALTQIENERERSTQELVQGMTGQIIANDNANAAMNASATIAVGDAILKDAEENKNEIIRNDNRNAAEINANVDQEGADTRKVGRDNRKIMRLDNERIIDTIKQDNQDGSSAEQPVTSEKPKYNPPSNNPEIGKGNKKEIGNAVEIGKLPQNEKEKIKKKN